MPIPNSNNFAAFIESRASEPQDFVCFLDAETGHSVTYWELRTCGVWLARELEAQHVERGGVCAVDMDNCPALFYTLVAAAYGGFSLVMLNARLTESEKRDRIEEIRRVRGLVHLPTLDERTALALVAEAAQAGPGTRNQLSQWARRGVGAFDELADAVIMFTSGTSGRPKAAALSWERLQGAARASNSCLNTEGQGVWQLALPAYHVGGLQVFFRSVLNRNAFLLYRRFDARKVLSDANMYRATHISVVDKMLQDMLSVVEAETQAPSAAAEDAFMPDSDEASAPVAGEAAGTGAVQEDAVDDGQQQGEGGEAGAQGADSTVAEGFDTSDGAQDEQTSPDLDNARAAQPAQDAPSPSGGPMSEAISSYECILLGGSRPNQATLNRALGQNARVYISYGMTETCSQVANALVQDARLPRLELLDGYEACVVTPGEDGFGQLGVRGPGVIEGYLNAQAAFTADGFFLTGDRAHMVDGKIEVTERSSDMFVSGGENVYPAEIRDKILAVEGVTDAHVFGAESSTWGRRPVAFVEAADASSRPGFNKFYFADELRNRLAMVTSPLYLPDQFVVVDEFPRTGVGKVGAGTLERTWNQRIQVEKVDVWQVKLPLVSPIRTAKHKLRERECVIVRLTDQEGRTGIGECSAFATDWYLPETIADDLPLICNLLGPLLVGRALLHPGDAGALFENAPGASEHPFACSALETAIWDLYGHVRRRSIRQLIGAREYATEEGALHELPAGCVHGGAVAGVGSPNEILATVNAAVENGYRRVKLKIRPGYDLKVVEAVRAAHPNLTLMLDANQSYKDAQIDVLKRLDDFDIECIEEPLDPSHRPSVGPTDLFDRLARLQGNLRMRVCLDESWTNSEQLKGVLEAHPELRCAALKIGKFGGLSGTLEFYKWARERGIEVWPGGMYDTGISKRLHAVLALLPGVNLAGDISDSSRYFTVDVCDPPFALRGGVLRINDAQHPYGLGCDVDEAALESVAVNHWVCE